MKYFIDIKIMPLKELLDPQGKAVNNVLHNNLNLTTINNVRIGKHITLEIEAETEEDVNNIINEACKKLLTNQVMETYTYTINN